MLPIGQALWLKELETYIDYPPMQDPASYNLEQVVAQVKAMSSAASRGRVARRAKAAGVRRLQPASSARAPTVGAWRKPIRPSRTEGSYR